MVLTSSVNSKSNLETEIMIFRDLTTMESVDLTVVASIMTEVIVVISAVVIVIVVIKEEILMIAEMVVVITMEEMTIAVVTVFFNRLS